MGVFVLWDEGDLARQCETVLEIHYKYILVKWFAFQNLVPMEMRIFRTTGFQQKKATWIRTTPQTHTSSFNTCIRQALLSLFLSRMFIHSELGEPAAGTNYPQRSGFVRPVLPGTVFLTLFCFDWEWVGVRMFTACSGTLLSARCTQEEFQDAFQNRNTQNFPSNYNHSRIWEENFHPICYKQPTEVFS